MDQDIEGVVARFLAARSSQDVDEVYFDRAVLAPRLGS